MSASNIENRQLLRWFTSMVTALTSSASSGGGTTAINAMGNTSVPNMNTADTGLSLAEKKICTIISSAMAATTPTSSIAAIL